ncbi:MAG: Gfo/Idh/MocA family oxidoreductase, partial [Enterococcus aquimarinus]
MKYALLTDWHVHTEGFLSKIPTDDCLYVWDFNKARGEQAAKKYNARYEENLEKVLADSAVEAVVIEAPTTMHTELILAAIAHGKHLFVDKPLAPTMTEALEIKAALEASSCRFVLSLES